MECVKTASVAPVYDRRSRIIYFAAHRAALQRRHLVFTQVMIDQVRTQLGLRWLGWGSEGEAV